MTKLSASAEGALVNTANRIGAPVAHVDSRVLEELLSAGLITDRKCLTRRGSIVRQRVLSARLDAFGEL